MHRSLLLLLCVYAAFVNMSTRTSSFYDADLLYRKQAKDAMRAGEGHTCTQAHRHTGSSTGDT